MKQDGDKGQPRYLIISADDFGYSEEVNSAVLRAHCNGALTSASLMVTEPAFQQAVEIAHNTPGLGVGLHVSVSFDHSLLQQDQIPGLVGPDGRLGADPLRVGVRYALMRKLRPQLQLEMEAQFKRFDSTGIAWSHADGHQHFHLHPTVWTYFIELCDAYSVSRIRLPHESVLQHLRNGGDRVGSNIAGLLAFRALRRKAIRDLERKQQSGRRYFWCDRVYGMLQTGNMNSDYVKLLLPRLEGVTNEIYFHPGSPHTKHFNTSTNEGDDVEVGTLLDAGLTRIAASQNIRTGSYSEVDLMMAEGSASIAESCSQK